MKAQTFPVRVSLPLGRGQKVMLSGSAGVLLASAVTLLWAVPKLPAQITLHYTNLADGTRPGPSSDLWILWVISAALWGVLASVVALAMLVGAAWRWTRIRKSGPGRVDAND